MQEKYYPIGKADEPLPFTLVPTVLGTYKKLRQTALKSTVATTETKLKIIEEFKLTNEEISNDLGLEDYFKELFLTLFLGAQKYASISPDVLDMGEINKALKDFFTKLEGS